MTDSLKSMLDETYNIMEGSELSLQYSERHGIKSAAILSVTDNATAYEIAEFLRPRIAGKTVVEIGGGLGLLSLHMGPIAKRVFCIEANPMWASGFAFILLQHKPKNVSYLFGAASEFAGFVKADIAIFCTHSGVDSMKTAAKLFASVVVDVHGEIIASNPERFDKFAREARLWA